MDRNRQIFLLRVNLPVLVHKGYLALSSEALKYDSCQR